ncbi:hypothetical protein SAMN02799631_06267 [Methylobacterium sp. 174MFSha1.1]|nr:hypothetical protein SAMN02799631_06267 [Methylobacterium sp. 174MFSha1.1]
MKSDRLLQATLSDRFRNADFGFAQAPRGLVTRIPEGSFRNSCHGLIISSRAPAKLPAATPTPLAER